MATITDVLRHLVTHSTGYPTAAERDEHLAVVDGLPDHPDEQPQDQEPGPVPPGPEGA